MEIYYVLQQLYKTNRKVISENMGLLNEWMKENVIDKGIDNVRFWTLMHPVNNILGVCFICGNDPEYWVECKVVEDKYKVEDSYKITLQSIDERFSREHYYQSDFESLINMGYIILKKSDNDHVERIANFEDIGSGLYIQTEGYVVVQ